ncbi:UNKNOWN [Stylonychia lemnae]|uniref:Uncharacterized protein n=1 Tax=Stylonychia lemnae TaxID=5949 RepID=A0A078AV66_STYLE|nr:UNKNOWN [Stylonychia lemnae]|eukprot:CDW84753.1 UNKNOWN [Stylonychia lemnae]
MEHSQLTNVQPSYSRNASTISNTVIQIQKINNLKDLVNQNSSKKIQPKMTRNNNNAKSQKQLPNVFYKKEYNNRFKQDDQQALDSLACTIYYTKQAVINSKRGQSEYLNEAIELELIVFKKEIEEKFAKSVINKVFDYPRQLSFSQTFSSDFQNEYQQQTSSLSNCKPYSQTVDDERIMKRNKSNGKINTFIDQNSANNLNNFQPTGFNQQIIDPKKIKILEQITSGSVGNINQIPVYQNSKSSKNIMEIDMNNFDLHHTQKTIKKSKGRDNTGLDDKFNNILFQQYKETAIIRDKSSSELSKVKRQQFQSLILQQKEKKNNIGSVIGQLFKQQNSKSKTRNLASSQLQNQGSFKQQSITQQTSDSNYYPSKSQQNYQINEQKIYSIQKTMQSLTPIKNKNQPSQITQQNIQKIQEMLNTQTLNKMPSQHQLLMQSQVQQEYFPVELHLTHQHSTGLKQQNSIVRTDLKKNSSVERILNVTPVKTKLKLIDSRNSNNLASSTTNLAGMSSQNKHAKTSLANGLTMLQQNQELLKSIKMKNIKQLIKNKSTGKLLTTTPAKEQKLNRQSSQDNKQITNIQIQANLNVIMNHPGSSQNYNLNKIPSQATLNLNNQKFIAKGSHPMLAQSNHMINNNTMSQADLSRITNQSQTTRTNKSNNRKSNTHRNIQNSQAQVNTNSVMMNMGNIPSKFISSNHSNSRYGIMSNL